jgi:hypothetical protein
MARRIAVSLKPGGRVVMIDPFHTLPLLLRNCRLTAREVIELFEAQGLRLREWSGAHFIPGRLLFTRPGMDKRPALTRAGYRMGELFNRLAPRRFADYIVIALEKKT